MRENLRALRVLRGEKPYFFQLSHNPSNATIAVVRYMIEKS